MTIPDPVTALLMLSHAVPPAGASKPARDLTQAEARDVTVYYALNGLLDLEKPIAFGKDGNPTFPKVGEKVKLGLEIGGVHFTPDNADAAKWTRTGPMDMRMAALAVRLAQYLKSSKWGVTTIFWGGMGVGRDATDRHAKGFALDFHGALGRGNFDVARDWGPEDHPAQWEDGEPVAVNVAPLFPAGRGHQSRRFFLRRLSLPDARGPRTPPGRVQSATAASSSTRTCPISCCAPFIRTTSTARSTAERAADSAHRLRPFAHRRRPAP
jgi:hypothetical protein